MFNNVTTTGLTTVFTYNIKLSGTETVKEIIDKTFNPVFGDIRNSNVVKEALAELTETNKKLQLIITEQKQEIDRMKPFENYHSLAMQLAHGNIS